MARVTLSSANGGCGLARSTSAVRHRAQAADSGCRTGGRRRLVEPHDYRMKHGTPRLLVYQLRGGGAPDPAARGWRMLDVAKIAICAVSESTFPGSAVEARRSGISSGTSSSRGSTNRQRRSAPASERFLHDRYRRGPPVRWILDRSLTLTMLGLFAIFCGRVRPCHRLAHLQLRTGRTRRGATVAVGILRSRPHLGSALRELGERVPPDGGVRRAHRYLVQKGSAESKEPDEHEPVDEDPRDADRPTQVPWPVRRGGLVLRSTNTRSPSPSSLLFLGSFIGHAARRRAPRTTRSSAAHGEPTGHRHSAT